MEFVSSCFRKCATVGVAGLCLLVLSPSAKAELGGNESSVKTDQQKLRGAVRVQHAQSFAVHEIRTENNSVVREFVSPEGKVFAVAYQGASLGESNQVLGSYSVQLAQAIGKVHGGRHVGGPVVVHAGNMVYEASGHMRSYTVRAYVPESMPAGVALEEIR
jgi:hypothetical protein